MQGTVCAASGVSAVSMQPCRSSHWAVQLAVSMGAPLELFRAQRGDDSLTAFRYHAVEAVRSSALCPLRSALAPLQLNLPSTLGDWHRFPSSTLGSRSDRVGVGGDGAAATKEADESTATMLPVHYDMNLLTLQLPSDVRHPRPHSALSLCHLLAHPPDTATVTGRVRALPPTRCRDCSSSM